MRRFQFILSHQDKRTKARVGEIRTGHGVIQTPAFVPVGTQATVKSVTPEELETLGTQVFFVNTYHIYLRPGVEIIKKFDGLHRFMHWNRPLITDSGGFQVFSLPFTKISDEGVQFRSHWDGSLHTFTPEKSIEIQHALGGDIILAFDDCTPYPVTRGQARRSLSRTHEWARRSLEAHQTHTQALYGVVQGSVYEDSRKKSAEFVGAMDFDGIAIGGVSVGESKEDMRRVLHWVVPNLPNEKPRHLLGVGEIDDIFELIERGIDTFDCVQPTRLARMGKLMGKMTIDITKTQFARDVKSIEENCSCYTCQKFTRAYIHHLFRVRELLGYRLATIHNLHFVHQLIDEIRESIQADRFLDLKKRWV